MKMSWLGTTAVALVIGSGAVIAQSQTDQKREEGPRPQQNQSKDTDRPSTADERAKKDRTAQPDSKGGAKEQRGEGPGDRKQQAQEPPRDTKQPSTQQSQDQQKGRDAKQPDSKQQQQGQQGQPKDNQARDTKQPEPKQQSRPAQPKQDNQARDAKQPADTKQQQGQQQPGQQPSGQQRGQTAQPSQPSTSTTQQTAPSATGQTGQQQTTGRSSDPSRPGGTSASTNINDQQRSQIVDRLRRDRSVSRQNINIQVSVGERLPPRARLQRLPPDIVRIAPRYRGYEYTVVEDRVYIVEPRTRRVVDVISESGPSTRTTSTIQSGGSERIVISQEQRETFKQVARRGMTSAPTSASPSGSLSDQSCLQLQPVPEELARNNPELSQYRYLTIGEQIVLVDPRQQKVVEVID